MSGERDEAFREAAEQLGHLTTAQVPFQRFDERVGACWPACAFVTPEQAGDVAKPGRTPVDCRQNAAYNRCGLGCKHCGCSDRKQRGIACEGETSGVPSALTPAGEDQDRWLARVSA